MENDIFKPLNDYLQSYKAEQTDGGIFRVRRDENGKIIDKVRAYGNNNKPLDYLPQEDKPVSIWDVKRKIPVNTRLADPDEVEYGLLTQTLEVPKERFFGLKKLDVKTGDIINQSIAQAFKFPSVKLFAGPEEIKKTALNGEAQRTAAALKAGANWSMHALKNIFEGVTLLGDTAVDLLAKPAPEDYEFMPQKAKDIWEKGLKEEAEKRSSEMAFAIKQFNEFANELIKKTGTELNFNARPDEALVYEGTQGAMSLLAAIGATVLAKNPQAGAAVFGAMQLGDTTAQGLEAGLSYQKAKTAGFTDAAWIGATELIGLKTYLKAIKANNLIAKSADRVMAKVPKNLWARFAVVTGAGAAAEGAQEYIQDTGTDLIKNAYGVQNLKLRQILEQNITSFVWGAVLGGGFGAAFNGVNVLGRAQSIANDLQKAGVSEEEAWTVAEQSAGEILSQDFIEDLAGPLIKENSPMTYPDFDKNKVGENLISAIEQQKDAAAQLADISEAYEEKLKASGVQEQEAQGAARIFANIIDNIAKRNKVSPKTAQGLLDFKMTREEQPLPAADTKEAYAQAAAMYRNPAKSLAEFVAFAIKNNDNPKEQNKSLYEFATQDNVILQIPFERAVHINKDHGLTEEQLTAAEQSFKNFEYAYSLPGVGEYNGKQVKLKTNTPIGKMGAVLEILPNGRIFVDTIFFDSDANIDNWAKGNPPNAPSARPVFIGEGINSLADIVKTVNGKEAYAQDKVKKAGSQNALDLTGVFKYVQDLTKENAGEFVQKELNRLIGRPLDTATPPLKIQVTKDNKYHIVSSNVNLKGNQRKRHQSALLTLEKIINKAVKIQKDGTVDLSHNSRPQTLRHKGNVEEYVYFLSPVKINTADGYTFFEVELASERVKGQNPDLLDLYNIRVKRTPAAAFNNTLQSGGSENLPKNIPGNNSIADIVKTVNDDLQSNKIADSKSRIAPGHSPHSYIIGDLADIVNGKLDKYRKNKGSEIPGREQTDTFNQPQERDLFAADTETVKTFSEKVRTMLADDKTLAGELLNMGALPRLYAELGLPDGSLQTNKMTLLKAVGKAGKHKHNVPQAVLEQLPKLIADPIAVFKSSGRSQNPKGYVAVLKAKNEEGKQIVAIISPKGKKYEFSFVPSVYERNNFEAFVQKTLEENRVLYIKDETALPSLHNAVLRKNAVSNNSILTKEDIVKKYRQGKRGSIELFKEGGVYTALVKIMQTGDKSTLMHELGHLWLYTAQDIYGFEEFEAVKKDLDAWLGKPSVVDGRFVYGRDQQEKFAQGLETYLMEGRAPAPTLQRIFEKFREWFLAIYNGALVEMSDAGRAVYDRLFTLAGADVKEHLTLYQDEVKNKKVRQAVKQLREEGRADVEGLNLQDVEDYLKILEMGAPPLPKDTLLAYLKKYGANYASAGKVDTEAYKNAKVPNKPQGIGDDLARRLIDWGFLQGDINTYEDLDALNEEAADMIQRALNGERVYRTEDAAAAEEFEAYKEAVAMAEDALGGRISEYKRVLKIIKGLRLEGYRPVSGKDIDFLLKQVENLEEAVSREERKAADKKLGRAQSENENLKERLEAKTANAARAQKEARAAKAQAEELKEKVLNPEDITEIHHSETGEPIELIFNDDLKPLETAELKKGAFPHEKDKGKNTKILLCDAVLGNNNKITLKNYGSDFILNKTSVGKMLSTAHRNATALFKKGKISEQQKNESIAAAKDFIAQIGSIFPQAQLIVSHKDAKHNTKKTIKRYAAKATYDGKDFYLMIVVKNNGTLQDFVIYDLQAEEKSRGGCISDAVSAGQYPTANNSIEDIKNFVKRRIAKYNKYFNKTYGQAGNKVYTLELQGKNKIAQTPQTQSKELSLEKHADQIKKAVVEELEKREVENKRQMLKELKDTKTPQDILEACENLLDKLEKAYENTPQGKMEKSKLEPPKTDWDRVKTGLLKTVTDILLEQNEKLAAAKDLLKEASRAKLGYRGALSENEKAALAGAKNFLKENYLPRVMAALKNAVKDLHHLSGRQADKMIGFYASTLTNFNGPLQRQINSFLSWARQAQKENYNRYIWRKVNAALDRKIFEKSGASLKAKFTERSMAFLEKAKEFLALKPEQAQREFENRIAAAFEKNTDQEPFEQRLLTGLLEFMTNGKNNDPESSKKLYDDISAFLAAGRKKVLDEAFRKTLNKEFLREAAAQALEQRKIPRGLEWFLNLPDTNLKEFLLNCFGTVEYDELDKDGNIRTVKTNIADALDTLKGQKRTQADIFYKTDRLNKIFMDVFGLQSAAGVINKIKELSRPCFTAENYMRQKNEAENQNAAQLIKGGKRVRKDLITEEKLNKLQIMTIWLWYKDTRYDPDAKADYGLRGRLIRQYEEHQLAQMFDLLSPQEIELAEKIQKFTADQYDEENAVFRRLHGFSLPQSENYFPSKARRADQAGETDYMRTYIQNSVNPNFTKKRVKSYRVEMNPLSVLKIAQEHFLRSAEYVNEAETFALLKSVLKSSRINTAFVNVFGQEKAGTLYNKMARLIDLQGPQKAANALKNELLDFVFNGWVKSAMALKLTIGLKQFASGVSFAENMPAGTWLKYFAQGLLTPRETMKTMLENIPSIQARAEQGGMNEYIRRILAKGDGNLKKTYLDSLTDFMLFNIRWGDKASFVYGGYPYFMYLTKEKGMSPKEAALKVEEQGEMTLQSSQKALLGERQRADVDFSARFFTVFRNQSKQYFGKLFTAYAQFKNGEISAAQFGKVFMLYAVLNPMIYTLLGFGWLVGGDGGDDEEKRRKALFDIAASPFTGLASVNAFAEYALRYILDAAYAQASGDKLPGLTSISTPAFDDIIRDVNKALSAYNSAGGLEELLGQMSVQDFALSAAELLKYAGLPAPTLINMASGVKDVFEDKPAKGALKLAGFTDYRAGVMTGDGPKRRRQKKKTKRKGKKRRNYK